MDNPGVLAALSELSPLVVVMVAWIVAVRVADFLVHMFDAEEE